MRRVASRPGRVPVLPRDSTAGDGKTVQAQRNSGRVKRSDRCACPSLGARPFLRGRKELREKRSGSISVCSWNVNQLETCEVGGVQDRPWQIMLFFPPIMLLSTAPNSAYYAC